MAGRARGLGVAVVESLYFGKLDGESEGAVVVPKGNGPRRRVFTAGLCPGGERVIAR